MIKPYMYRLFILALFCPIGLATHALAQAEPSTAMKSEMRDAYATARSLFELVWSGDSFADPENKDEILTLLQRLSRDFHQIEKSANARKQEPGFEVILKVQQNMLEDVRSRFAEGKVEYAQWRLKNILHNCAACHSRFEAPYDFSGQQTLDLNSTIEQRIAHAELLFASRQFEDASKEFFAIATELHRDRSTIHTAIQALKQWLVIQVRVNHRWERAATQLTTLLEEGQFIEVEREMLQAWIADLQGMKEQAVENEYYGVIATVGPLLRPVLEAEALSEQDKHLASTLRATALLHNLLDSDLSEEQRRAALLLLGRSYTKLSINSLNPFAELYLERCIREYPQTAEARQAYEILAEVIVLKSSGSGGTHIAKEDRELLARLRDLAGVK